MPKISVIVPIYNVEKYLRECVDSILAQDYTDFEVILIDDGSPDRCGTICDEYAKQDKRVRVIHQENKGVSVARNVGMEAAAGEWIMFVDPDDWLEKNTLSFLYRKAIETQCEIVSASFYWSYLDNEFPAKSEQLGGKIYGVRENWQFILECVFCRREEGKQTWMRGVCWKLYCAEHLREHQICFPVDLKFSEDMIFNLRAIFHAKKICMADTPVYHYRMRKSSACHVDLSDMPTRWIESYNAIYALMKEHPSINGLKYGLYNRIYCDLSNFVIAQSITVYNKGSFLMALQKVESFSNREICREVIENIDLRDMPIKRRIIWFFLRNHMYRTLLVLQGVYHHILFPKEKPTEILWP